MNIADLKDINKYPIIDSFNLEDIFDMEYIDDKYRSKYFDHYKYNGIGVPRVTHILDACIDHSGLMHWAAKLGEQEMARVRRESLDVGSIVHEMIDNYLINGTDLELDSRIPKSYIDKIMTAYNNFKKWNKRLNDLGFYIEEVIAIELPVVCHLYGGTIDAILKINSKVYIVDFKTSKVITHEYILQTSSYYWMVNNGYAPIDIPHIDGIGIIRVDKVKDQFEDLFLNENIPGQWEILNNYVIGWGAILSSYYNNINLRLMFSKYKKQYNFSEVISYE